MQEMQNMQLNYYIQLVLNSWTREQIQQFENYLDLHIYLQDFPSVYSSIFDEKMKKELSNLEKISDKQKIQIKRPLLNTNMKATKYGREINFGFIAAELKPSKQVIQFIIIMMQFYLFDALLSQQQKPQSLISQQFNNIDQYEYFLEFLSILLEYTKNNNNENEARWLIQIILILIKYKPITVEILSENQKFIATMFNLIQENYCCLEVLFLLNECWNKININLIEKQSILDYYDELLSHQNIEMLPKYIYQIKILLKNDSTLITEYLMKNQKNINDSQINYKFEILYCLNEQNYEIGFHKFIRLFDKIEQPNLNNEELRFMLIFLFTSIGKLNRSQLKCAKFMMDKIQKQNPYLQFIQYLKNLLDYFFRIDMDGGEIQKLLQSKSQSQLQTNNLINLSRQGSFSKKVDQRLITSSSYQQIMQNNPNLQLVLSDKTDDFAINLQQSISILEKICHKVETDIEQTVRTNQKALGLICLFPFEEILFVYCEEIFQSYNLQQLRDFTIDQLCWDEYQLSIYTILSFYEDLFNEAQKCRLSQILNEILMSHIDQLTMTYTLLIIKNLKFQETQKNSLISLLLNAESNEVNEILILQILLNQNQFEPPEQIVQQKFQNILPMALNQIKQNNFYCTTLIKFELILSITQKFNYKFYSRAITDSIFQSFKWFNVGLEEALQMIKFFGFIWHDRNSFYQQSSNKLSGLIENTMKKMITQKQIFYSQLQYSSIKIMMITLSNIFVKQNETGSLLFDSFINLFAALTEITFSESIQMKQFVKFCLMPALTALSIYNNQQNLPKSMNLQVKSLINLLQKEEQQLVKFEINFLVLLFSTIEKLIDDQIFCDLFCEFQDFEKCLKQIGARRHHDDLDALSDRIFVKMQLQKPVEYNYAALLGDSYEESKYYSVLKDENQFNVQDNQISLDCKEQIANLKTQFETIKSLSQKQIKHDQLKYTFWIIEQNIINDQTAQYSHEIGLTNILIKYHHFKGALYCLSKVLSHSSEQQNIISQLGWQQLKLDKLSDEILEFLIQNSNIKAIQQLLQSQITHLTQFNADWSTKIKKKIFLCLNAYCSNHVIAERYYEQNVVEQILKHFTIAKSECTLLVGSICLSQNAQASVINTEIGDDIISGLNTTDVQLLANSYYALSGICYNQSYVQLKYINSEILTFMAQHMSMQSDIIVIEALSQLISNLTYNNNQAKQTLSKFIPALISVSLNFTQNINKEEWIVNTKLKTLKSLLRALNNLIYIRENCLKSMQHQMEDLCSIIFESNIFCEEFFDILTNLGIHQQLTKNQIIGLNFLIQENRANKLKLIILDAINSASKQYCDMISQEFQLETYKNMLIQEMDRPETVLRIYRLVSNLLFNHKNYLYLEQCKFFTVINESSNQQIQHYYAKIQQQIGKTKKSQKLLGSTSPQQNLFTVSLVKGNLLLQKALLNINKEEISVTQNGIKKNKYLIQNLKENITDVNVKTQEFKILNKVINLQSNLCLCLIGSNQGQQNRIIFQTASEEEKNIIIECVNKFKTNQISI